VPKHPRILGLELHVSSHHQRWWELAKPGSLAVFIWKMINHWDFGGSTRASKQHRLQMMHQQDTADLFPKIFMVSEVISKTASSWIQLTYGIMGQFWWTRNQCAPKAMCLQIDFGLSGLTKSDKGSNPMHHGSSPTRIHEIRP
jgi:hypothetical protein